MANVHRLRSFDRARMTEYPVDSAQVIEVGDMVYLEVDDVRPASAFTYSSLAETQTQFAKQFVGVAMDSSASGDTDPIRVAKAGRFEFACASATFEVGDIIGPDDNAGASALEDQQVIALGEGGVGSIARVAKRYSASTTSVLVEIFPRDMQPEILIPIPLYSGLITAAADYLTDYPILFPFKAVRLESVVNVLTSGAGVISLHKNTTALDDTLTIADASAVGAVDTAVLDDSTGDDIFDMGDTISLVGDGTPSAGEATFTLWVKPYFNES